MDSPLNLREEDGYRISSSGEPLAPEKLLDIDGQKYAVAKDLVGHGAGRVFDWKLIENLESARGRNWPFVRVKEFLGETVVICGSGPSIGKPENLREIRRLQKKGAKIHAINRCHDFLCSKGIVPDSASLLDPIPHVADYIKPRRGVDYFIGFQCDPATFDVFDRADINHFIWYCTTSKMIDAQLTPQEMAFAVPSRTSTNGLRSILLNYMRGFRRFVLAGFDASYETYIDDAGVEQIKLGADGKGKLHAHAKPETVHDVRPTKVYETAGDGRVIYERDYFTNSAMLSQAEEFKTLIDDLTEGIRGGFIEDISIAVMGDGLIPDICCSSRYPLHYDRKRIRTHG